MAYLLDIETALVNLCASVIYPNGISSPSAAAGFACKIFPGWPNQIELEKALSGGVTEISIYSGQNLEQVTTRYSRDWFDVKKNAASITATVSGTTVTIGGSIVAADYISLIINDQAYSYLIKATDTPTSVAAGLYALIPPTFRVSLTGAVMTLVPATYGRIVARTAAPGVIGREIGRQKRGMMISIWAPSPQARAAFAALLMVTIQRNDFLPMPDGSQAWLTYRQSNESDGKENAMAYRCDIQIWAEYATLETAVGYPITAPVTQVNIPPNSITKST